MVLTTKVGYKTKAFGAFAAMKSSSLFFLLSFILSVKDITLNGDVIYKQLKLLKGALTDHHLRQFYKTSSLINTLGFNNIIHAFNLYLRWFLCSVKCH